MKGVREMERETEEKRGQWMEGGREKEGINSSGALIPHYPGRALSPWQCGRKRIAKAWWASTHTHAHIYKWKLWFTHISAHINSFIETVLTSSYFQTDACTKHTVLHLTIIIYIHAHTQTLTVCQLADSQSHITLINNRQTKPWREINVRKTHSKHKTRRWRKGIWKKMTKEKQGNNFWSKFPAVQPWSKLCWIRMNVSIKHFICSFFLLCLILVFIYKTSS